MKLRYEKSIRILNDLLGYCHFLGGDVLHSDLELLDGLTRVRVVAELPHPGEEEMDCIRRLLGMPRQREIEQNYWNISGEEEIEGELSLVGMMTDRYDIHYEAGALRITVERLETTREV